MASHEKPDRRARIASMSCAMLSSAWLTSAHAYRPFESTDASVVDPGVIEIELGPFAYADVRRGSIIDVPTITVNSGLSSRWELVADATRAIARSAASRDVETFESALLLKGVVREGALQDEAGWSVATEFGVLPLFGTTTMHVAALFSLWGDTEAKSFIDSVKTNGVQIAASNGESQTAGECQ